MTFTCILLLIYNKTLASQILYNEQKNYFQKLIKENLKVIKSELTNILNITFDGDIQYNIKK